VTKNDVVDVRRLDSCPFDGVSDGVGGGLLVMKGMDVRVGQRMEDPMLMPPSTSRTTPVM
jgi:hypothetical protein